MGQLAGDSLGSLVEFRKPEQISKAYPDGVRELADGGTWNTLAGQPTDDSEMALALARTIVKLGTYDPRAALESYVEWLASGPFDCGGTIAGALRGHKNPDSQANGALMRASPLGIFGAGHPLDQVATWGEQDAELTHVNQVCRQCNVLYVMAIADAIRNGTSAEDLYGKIATWAAERKVDAAVAKAVAGAQEAPPEEYTKQSGWILIAFRNALWQLLHASDPGTAVIDTVGR